MTAFHRCIAGALLLTMLPHTPGLAQETKPPPKGNVACAWSLFKMVLTFEDVCGADQPEPYRTALAEAVQKLEARALALNIKEVENSRHTIGPLVKEMIEKDPAQCRRGDLLSIVQTARAKGADGLRAETSKFLAIRRENLTNGCL